jgi:cytochrome c oxidase subunit I
MLFLLRKAVKFPIDLIAIPGEMVHSDYSRQWLKVGLFSLLLSGLFSLIIVVARTPGIAELINDPLFARKSLVLHVDFALVVWFYAFLAALYYSLADRINPFLFSVGIKLSITGIFFMMIPVFIRDAEPILANYIPVLDHPFFFAGLLSLGAGFVLTFLSSILQGSSEIERVKPEFYTPCASYAIKSAGIVFIIAVFTIITSALITPDLSNRQMFFELSMWGGGHILQFANVLGMITVWLILLKKITGRDIVSERLNRWLIMILVIPAAISPLLLLQGTTSQLYYSGFTQLMRWFIFPVVTVYMIIGIRAVWRHYRNNSKTSSRLANLYFNGFVVSALLTLIGFILGAMIRGSSTLIPAHYHASLGGITVAYMAMVFIMMNSYGYTLKSAKKIWLMNIQPLLFGIGQAIFVIGFAYAGMMGMGRKMFGQDQNIHTMEALVGLGLMSIGGLLAMAGGLLFIYIVVKSTINGKNQI